MKRNKIDKLVLKSRKRTTQKTYKWFMRHIKLNALDGMCKAMEWINVPCRHSNDAEIIKRLRNDGYTITENEIPGSKTIRITIEWGKEDTQ